MIAVHLRYPTRLGLWSRQQARPLVTPIRIYPDIRAVYRYELMSRQNRLSEIGVRMVRMPGQGREFERLREFRYGDEIRQIDWKATARQRALISREFNVERNQNIVIMVDCGRFMRNETDGISYLDRALNSAIMLSYIALGQGDNVSLLAFSKSYRTLHSSCARQARDPVDSAIDLRYSGVSPCVRLQHGAGVSDDRSAKTRFGRVDYICHRRIAVACHWRQSEITFTAVSAAVCAAAGCWSAGDGKSYSGNGSGCFSYSSGGPDPDWSVARSRFAA